MEVKHHSVALMRRRPRTPERVGRRRRHFLVAPRATGSDAQGGATGRPVEAPGVCASGERGQRTAMARLSLNLGLLLLLPALLAPASGQGLEAFFEASGQVVRGTAPETRLYWRSHIDTSRARILQAADLAGGSEVATVLGSGLGMEIPLAELAGRFDRLVLVDLDGRSMLRSLDQVPRHLRSRVELKVMDVTSFAAALIESIDHAVDGSSSAREAFQRLGLILDELSAGDPAQLPPSDLVVSSLLLSEIPRYPFSYAAQAVETRFGAAIQTWDRSDEFFRSLVALAVEDHVRLLASLVEPEGVIYFSDTVAKGLVRRPQGEAVRRSVEARALPDFAQLGLAGSPAEVASAVDRLCRAEHSPAAESAAFERILSLYRDASPELFEPLLPVGGLRDRSAQLGLELRGSPESWWWLAYPCRIRAESGAFLVTNWILGLRN